MIRQLPAQEAAEMALLPPNPPAPQEDADVVLRRQLLAPGGLSLARSELARSELARSELARLRHPRLRLLAAARSAATAPWCPLHAQPPHVLGGQIQQQVRTALVLRQPPQLR
jgi:hypothetical protein